MKWSKRHSFAAFVVVCLSGVVGFFAYNALVDPAPPESFTVPVFDECGGDPEVSCSQSEWMVDCYYDVEDGREYCMDSFSGEYLCPVPVGPHWSNGSPYYSVEWDYCEVLSWSGESDFFGVDEDLMGLMVSVVGVPVGKGLVTRIVSGSQVDRIAKAVQERLEEA